jgi:hypothetical protein
MGFIADIVNTTLSLAAFNKTANIVKYNVPIIVGILKTIINERKEDNPFDVLCYIANRFYFVSADDINNSRNHNDLLMLMVVNKLIAEFGDLSKLASYGIVSPKGINLIQNEINKALIRLTPYDLSIINCHSDKINTIQYDGNSRDVKGYVVKCTHCKSVNFLPAHYNVAFNVKCNNCDNYIIDRDGSTCVAICFHCDNINSIKDLSNSGVKKCVKCGKYMFKA